MRPKSLHMAWFFVIVAHATAQEPRIYHNRLTPIRDPKPLLADHPDFVAPVDETARFEAPILVDDMGGDLHVRAWRFSYNARGIIEMPNRLKAVHTAVIVVHPWGIDDDWGWKTPEPAGACDFCTPAKNKLASEHTRMVIDPFLASLRGKTAFIMYSLIGDADPLRKKLYRTIDGRPTAAERTRARTEVRRRLAGHSYKGEPIPEKLNLTADLPVRDYFRQFHGLDAGPRYNGVGFWNLPVPVTSALNAHEDDVLIFDVEGYPKLRDFLKKHGVRHVLLAGYATDMCFCKTTAGYENLSKDFNVFLVGDATLATFPGNSSPRHATNAAISFAALNQLVTQVSWIRLK